MYFQFIFLSTLMSLRAEYDKNEICLADAVKIFSVNNYSGFKDKNTPNPDVTSMQNFFH